VSSTEGTRLVESLVERIAVGVAFVSPQERWLCVNPRFCELFGLSREELMAGTWQDLIHSEERDAARALVRRLLAGECDEAAIDTRYVRKDSVPVWVHLSVSLVRTADGAPDYFTLTAQDITERMAMEALLATAAHDLRVPLSAVVGYLALAENASDRLVSTVQGIRPDLTPQVTKVRDRVEEAGEGAERLTRLLTRLFDVAAIRADHLVLHRAPCDLVALVREQVEALRVAAPGRTIRLHVPVHGAPMLVEADADRIGQVITNYGMNALKYSPQDQPVDVSVRIQREPVGVQRVARVVVRDWGQGVPKEEQARVWELFYRVPGVTAPGETQGGTQGCSLGLGLYICKAIVEAHGGRVGVTSRVGQGSTFWFTLPLIQTAAR
jgi:PAS domain S-box-containing protein